MDGLKKQLCSFRVDDLLLGVNVLDVQEVILSHDSTPVPGAPNVVGGLMNLRGEIVTTLDLRRRFRREDLGAGDPMNVVVRSQGELFSFLVDRIGDVIEVDEETFEEPPETLDDEMRELIVGTYKLDEELLLVLDKDKAANIE